MFLQRKQENGTLKNYPDEENEYLTSKKARMRNEDNYCPGWGISNLH